MAGPSPKPNFCPAVVERDPKTGVYEHSSTDLRQVSMFSWSPGYHDVVSDYVDKHAVGLLSACTNLGKTQESPYRAAESSKNQVFPGFLGGH